MKPERIQIAPDMGGEDRHTSNENAGSATFYVSCAFTLAPTPKSLYLTVSSEVIN